MLYNFALIIRSAAFKRGFSAQQSTLVFFEVSNFYLCQSIAMTHIMDCGFHFISADTFWCSPLTLWCMLSYCNFSSYPAVVFIRRIFCNFKTVLPTFSITAFCFFFKEIKLVPNLHRWNYIYAEYNHQTVNIHFFRG